MTALRLAIIGAGWAGLAAAVQATRQGQAVTVFDAARVPGGRARSVAHVEDDGTPLVLDNGQHILIGAYTQTLAAMQAVGVMPDQALLRLPLDLRLPDGSGIVLPDIAPPWDGLLGMARARGWSWRDRAALLVAAARWRLGGFRCDPETSVATLCAGLPRCVLDAFVEPLCLSAMNTSLAQASGQVFLRVLRDALLGGPGGSNLLIPRLPLGQLFPEPAVDWLRAHGQAVHLGQRVQALRPFGAQWQVDGQNFDRVLLACPSWEAMRLVQDIAGAGPWRAQAQALHFTAIATVYARSAQRLPRPMVALPSSPGAPAQFVFDRRQLGDEAHGLLAFVISVSEGTREALEQAVLQQARTQLGLTDLQAVTTIVEKRATFACTPGLVRPGVRIAAGLAACGEYVAGPYPGTIEGAVRSAQEALAAL